MGLFDDVGKSFQSGGLFSSIGDFVGKGVQAVGNYYGFDNSGKWTNQGGVFKWIDEGLGGITGRNQSRAALNQARDQFSYAQQQAEKLIQNQQWKRQQDDLVASNAASGVRATQIATQGMNYSNTAPAAIGPGSKLGSSQKDFLGL